jgi:hypothetical protein
LFERPALLSRAIGAMAIQPNLEQIAHLFQ